MAWTALIFAGIFEMLGITMMNEVVKKQSLKTIGLLILAFSVSFLLLAYAMETIPMGTAYAIWTGIGASGGALIGMFFYNEGKDWRRIACIGIIIAAVVGLKYLS
jgi:paired small multidrug resistance pump